MARLNWMAIDPYSFDMSKVGLYSLDNLNNMTRNAASFARLANPTIERWLVVQGFAQSSWYPTDGEVASNPTLAVNNDFANFMRGQFDIANTTYEGVIVFGWQFRANDIPSYENGSNFPNWLKKIYFNFANQFN